MTDPRQEAVVTAVAKTTVYASAGGSVFLGLTANEVAAIGGLFVAIIALVLNTGISIYFKMQHLKLAQRRAAEKCDIPEDDRDPE